MNAQQALSLAVELIKPFEGLHQLRKDGLVYPYLCPAGVWTIGWGSTHYADGRKVQKDDPPLSPEACDRLFELTLPLYLMEALKASPDLAGRPNALAAVTSFIQNLGPGRYRASTYRRKVNAHAGSEAALECLKWVYGGGRVLPGLVKRRYVESQILLKDLEAQYTSPESVEP